VELVPVMKPVVLLRRVRLDEGHGRGGGGERRSGILALLGIRGSVGALAPGTPRTVHVRMGFLLSKLPLPCGERSGREGR
jgi:hypothetical protein